MKIKTIIDSVMTIALLATYPSCAPARRVNYLVENDVRADLSLPSDRALSAPDTVMAVRHDTLTVHDFDGREVIIMNAVKDESGEMVAHDVIDAAVVTARFRNVAERHGKVDLQFNITVPESMRSSAWQLRLYPDLFVLEDSLRLEPLVITGEGYRRAQLRGYQQYERFLASIVKDTSRFVNIRQLEIFLERNIPALYAFKSDSTFVSDERFRSLFGVCEQEAVEHYTDRIARSINRWKKSRTSKMYQRYVKVPIVRSGVRLDTVLRSPQGEFIYCYTQTIDTRPRLRKADVVLSGEIYESSRRIYSVPRSEPLSFYISSISAFVDGSERYMTKIIERKVEANTACYIDFAQGRSDIDISLGYNGEEIGRIKGNLRDLLENEKFDMDSITISAFASLEGSERSNASLAMRRARSASDFFNLYVRQVRDSIRRESGYLITYDDSGRETVSRMETSSPIRFVSHSGGENWDMFRNLVEGDSHLSQQWKEDFAARYAASMDHDALEKSLAGDPEYRYLREHIYPRLRIVKFDFYLHRKGMVKDTVHTTVRDENYMAGVQAIRDRDYEKAIGILRPYNDFNAAVAFTAMDYNASAMAILAELPSSGQVEYLKAILFSRSGEVEKAVQCFINAVGYDRSFMSRGNLDPEIRQLIKTYNLDRRDEDQFDYSF